MFSVLLKAVAAELQRIAVFRHSPNNIIRRAVGNIGGNFQRNRNVRADQTGEMRNDLLGHLAGIASYSGGVQFYATVKAAGQRLSCPLVCAAFWGLAACNSHFMSVIGLRFPNFSLLIQLSARHIRLYQQPCA